MRRIVTGFVCAGLCAGAVVAGTTPALASTASTKKVPVLAVKQSASKVATGGSVTFTPALHLPAHDKLASWALTFGDGNKSGAKAKSLPHSVKHTYKKKFSGHAVLTVTDTKKHHWSVSLPISVVTLTFAGGGAAATSTTPATTTTTTTTVAVPTDPTAITPPATTTTLPPPASPYCTFPSTASYTGPLAGRVTSGGVGVAGVAVSITDGVASTGASVASLKTDAQGNWTLPAGTVAPGLYGYDVKINNSNSAADPDAPANPAYDVEELSCLPATGYKLNSELPPTVVVTGTVISLPGSMPATMNAVAQLPDGTGITTVGTVSSNGTYTLHLGVGLQWNIFAAGLSTSSTLNVTATTTSGPIIIASS